MPETTIDLSSITPEDIEEAKKDAEAQKLAGSITEKDIKEAVPVGHGIGQGLAYGLTLGTMPTLAAGLKSAIEAPFSEEDIGDLYDKYRKMYGQKYSRTREAQPAAFFGGELVGSAALGAPAKLGLGARSLIEGGLAGGAEAISSQKEGKEYLKDVFTSAGIGAAAPVGLEKVLGPAARWVGKRAKDTAYGVGHVVGGVPRELQEKYLARAPELSASQPLAQTGDEIIDAVGKLKQDISRMSGESYDILEASGARFDPRDIIPKLQGIQNKLTVQGVAPTTGDAAKAYNEIGKHINMLKRAAGTGREALDPSTLTPMAKTISAPEVKKIIQNLDTTIKQAGKGLGEFSDITQRTALEARRAIDRPLKEAVPEYKDVMGKLAPKAEDLRRIPKAYKGENARDLVVNRMKRISENAKNLRPEEREIIATLGQHASEDFIKKIDDRLLYESFLKPHQVGSRNVKLFSILGGLIGNTMGHMWVGLSGGASLGASLDKKAPAITKAVLDRIYQLQHNPSLQRKFNTVLNAAKRGEESMMVTHQLMRQNDPTYREWIEGREKGPHDAER